MPRGGTRTRAERLTAEGREVEVAPGCPHRLVTAAVDEICAEHPLAVAEEHVVAVRTQTRSPLDQCGCFLGGHELPQLAEFVQITEDFDADRLINAADANGGEAAHLN